MEFMVPFLYFIRIICYVPILSLYDIVLFKTRMCSVTVLLYV